MEILSPIITPPIVRVGSFTLDATMAGGIISVNASAACTITIPTGLPLGFACTIVQTGAGVITYAVAAGMGLTNVNSHTKSMGQRSIQSILLVETDRPILSGQTAA